MIVIITAGYLFTWLLADIIRRRRRHRHSARWWRRGVVASAYSRKVCIDSKNHRQKCNLCEHRHHTIIACLYYCRHRAAAVRPYRLTVAAFCPSGSIPIKMLTLSKHWKNNGVRLVCSRRLLTYFTTRRARDLDSWQNFCQEMIHRSKAFCIREAAATIAVPSRHANVLWA